MHHQILLPWRKNFFHQFHELYYLLQALSLPVALSGGVKHRSNEAEFLWNYLSEIRSRSKVGHIFLINQPRKLLDSDLLAYLLKQCCIYSLFQQLQCYQSLTKSTMPPTSTLGPPRNRTQEYIHETLQRHFAWIFESDGIVSSSSHWHRH